MHEEQNVQNTGASKMYVISIVALMFVIPIAGAASAYFSRSADILFNSFIKWFIFSAVGLRLTLAGLRQITKPAFTVKEIFHIQGTDSFPVVRELGFANLCFGLVGIVSLFKPEWRIVSAFASGLYYGCAGAMHIIKRPAGTNERIALWTDLFAFAILIMYFVKNY
ncbi:MAG: hypothetical protein QM802_03325 [Agriterribacter sp.]